jgi:hypothetical protein
MAKVHFPWLGNKTGFPRVPGASKQRRAAQVTGSGYPTVGSLMRAMGPQTPKGAKLKF